MKNAILIISLILPLCLILLSSCDDSEPNPISVGLISGVGGFDDMGFNTIALSGLTRAQQDFDITGFPTICEDTTQLTAKLNDLTSKKIDLIFTLGFESLNYTMKAANENPDLYFVIVDQDLTEMPANLSCFSYQVDQSAFLCGYLAAWWANYKDPQNPVLAWIGGYPYPSIESFKVGYLNGINYFNSKYSKNVQAIGAYTMSFEDQERGSEIADSLITAGADVVFPFAGKAGNGALLKAKELSKWGIGVDIDQAISLPEVSDILLTSCTKQLDVTIYNLIKDFVDARELPTGTFYGNLENEGVNMAPFHAFESTIPDSVKNELNLIKTQIISGTIITYP